MASRSTSEINHIEPRLSETGSEAGVRVVIKRKRHSNIQALLNAAFPTRPASAAAVDFDARVQAYRSVTGRTTSSFTPRG